MASRGPALAIRPYARLLTMLGEQLIKNERIALIELIKNSYDADATWVKITFQNFGDHFSTNPKSKIIIEDNGVGMTKDKIENSWLHPATPDKKLAKQKKPKTAKGRLIQGEKGIGRFAILKLGRKIELITRAQGEKVEHIVDYDLSKYDDDFLTEDKKSKELFIDQIPVYLRTQNAQIINKNPIDFGARKERQSAHGTIIEITNLKSTWTENKIENIYLDITKLLSIFPGAKVSSEKADFNVEIYKNDKRLSYGQDYIDMFHELLNSKAVFRITDGHYDQKNKIFRYNQNGVKKSLDLDSPEITGLRVFKSYFKDQLSLENRKTECGDFDFNFYIFDFSPQASLKFKLDKEDKKIIRPHRTYLYRDGIRVYPYGDPEDDWLHIDQWRGTISAGGFLSNDQVVGVVQITQEHNENLRDKTNREGLVEVGNASSDLIALLQTFLSYMRSIEYKKYQLNMSDKNAHDIFKGDKVQEEFAALREAVSDSPKIKRMLAEIENHYLTEKSYLTQRAERTEDLAGVGLSVETASHDIMAVMRKLLLALDGLIKDTLYPDTNLSEVNEELTSLKGMASFIEAQLKDIQLLFRSSKGRRKNIRVGELVEKVERIYSRILKQNDITLRIIPKGSPLVAKTTDAVLLQLLINLFDNSIYWLGEIEQRNKEICIILDGDKGKMIFSDNGPGVRADDAPYIFEPFFSGRGEEGRGLGLYIARQLLERNDYSIDLAGKKDEKILKGANMVVNFISEEE